MQGSENKIKLTDEQVAENNERMMKKLEESFKKELLALGKKTIEELKQINSMAVANTLKYLKDEERELIYYLYGICDGTTKSYIEACEKFGHTIEEVKKIEQLSLRKIRPCNSIEEYLYKTKFPKEIMTEQAKKKIRKMMEDLVSHLSETEQRLYKLEERADEEEFDLDDIAKELGITKKEAREMRTKIFHDFVAMMEQY